MLMACFPAVAVELGEGRGCSAGRWHAVEDTGKVTRGDDHAVAVPGAAARRKTIYDGLDGPSRNVDLLEFSLLAKTQKAAVRGPEGVDCPLCPGERPGGQGI